MKSWSILAIESSSFWPCKLRAEELLLQVGVVQLGVGVGDLHALNEQLKPLGDGRVVALALGQRADAGRVVEHEDRARELVLDLLLKDLALDHVGMLAGGFEADLLGELLHGGLVVRRNAGVLLEQLVVGFPCERRREVDRLFAPRQLARGRRDDSTALTMSRSVRSIIVR